MLLFNNRPSYPRTHQLVMSRKKAQPAGLSWKPSSLWNSEMRTSLSVVPMQLNFCMRSASTSISVPSMDGGSSRGGVPLSIKSEASFSHNDQLNNNNKRQCAWHEHEPGRTTFDVATVRASRKRHLLLFVATFSLVYQ